MSDKEWYEGLTADDFEGKHVRAVSSDGAVIEGALRIGDGPAALISCNGADVCVLAEDRFWDGGKSWELSDKIESVSLVWDERDWEQISLKDADEGDSLVIGGDLYSINEARFVDDPSMPIWWSVEEDSYIVPPDMVSCALRRRHKLPTEPGFYRDGDGTLYYLSTLAEFWIMRTRDKWDCMAWLPDKPLIPVHFVDGRAE